MLRPALGMPTEERAVARRDLLGKHATLVALPMSLFCLMLCKSHFIRANRKRPQLLPHRCDGGPAQCRALAGCTPRSPKS